MANGYNSGNNARRGGNFGGNAAATGKPTGATQSTAIFSTGLFVPDREGVKAMASVQVKEEVVIPAGSYISIYHNDLKKSETSPDYRLQVRPGKMSSK